MKVQSILREKGRNVETVQPDILVGEAVRMICAKRIGALVVTDESDRLVGVFSERDLVRAISDFGAAALDKTVGDIMTKEVQTCSRFDTVHDVMSLMTRRRFRHVPVVENGEIVGLVSIGDAVKARITDAENEAEALKEYIATG